MKLAGEEWAEDVGSVTHQLAEVVETERANLSKQETGRRRRLYLIGIWKMGTVKCLFVFKEKTIRMFYKIRRVQKGIEIEMSIFQPWCVAMVLPNLSGSSTFTGFCVSRRKSLYVQICKCYLVVGIISHNTV